MASRFLLALMLLAAVLNGGLTSAAVGVGFSGGVAYDYDLSDAAGSPAAAGAYLSDGLSLRVVGALRNGYDPPVVSRVGASVSISAENPFSQVKAGEGGSASPAVGAVGTFLTPVVSFVTPRAAAGGGDDVVSLYRALQRGQATGPLNPADFRGRGGAVPDGRVYFTPDRQLAEVFEKSYGNGIIRVDMPRSSYDRMLRTLDGVQDAGAFRYQGGPLTEVAVPRWMVPWVNKFPMGPG